MKTSFVTGVSSGLGHALCEELLRCGDAVYGISRREPAKLLAHERFHFASVDLTDHAAAERTIRQLLDGVEQIDLAILNAGVLANFGDMNDTLLEELRHVMEVNVWANKTVIDSLMHATKAVSQVITISSGASVNGNRGWNGYSISKAALNMLTALYAKEYPATHFCPLAPGVVDTDMQQQVADAPEDARFPALQRLRSMRESGEMPTPREAAIRLLDSIERLPKLVESGSYADVRKPPLAS